MGSRRIHLLLSIALPAIAASACTVTQGSSEPYEPGSVVPPGWTPSASAYNSPRLGEYMVAGRGAQENPPPPPGDQRCVDMECGMDNGVLCGVCDPRANLVCENHRCAGACENMNCGVNRGVQCGTCLAGDICTSANVCAFWAAAADAPACLRAASSAELGGKLFIVGGQKAAGQVMRVDCFDPESGDTRTRADIPAWSAGLTGFLDGDHYLLFGENYSHMFAEYDIANDTWTPQQQFSAQVGAVTAALIDGDLQLLIGSQFGPFDPGAQPLQWNGSSLTWSHTGGAAFVQDERVYVFEHDTSYPVHVFDSLLQSWSNGPTYPSARSGFVPVRAGDLVYLIGGTATQVEVFDLQTGTWGQPAESGPVPQNLPVAVTEHAAVAAGGKLYVLGGRAGAGARSDTLQVLDIETGEWTVTRMPRGRVGATAAILDDEICLFGGSDLSTDVDALSYDPEEDEWAVLPPLPESAIEPAVVGTGDKLYVFTNEGQAFVYDVRDEAWSPLSPPAPGNRNFAAAALDGQIYLVGGNQNLTQVYDIENDAWSSAPPMQVGRSGLALATLDGEIFAFGGLDNATGAASTRVERFSPDTTGQWSNERVMPVGLWRHSVVELNGTFYVIGGSTGAAQNNNGAIMLAYDPDANDWQALSADAPMEFGSVHLLRHGDRIVITGGDTDGSCQTKSFVLNPRPDFPEVEALEEPQVTTPPQCVFNAGLYDGVSCSCGSAEMISCNQQCMSSYSTQNCGRCGVTCLPNQTCSSGTCTDSL